MNKKKNNSLVDSLKEYNKTLAEQINRIKSFIEDIDKQINHHRRLDQRHTKVRTPFSRDYLAYKARTNVN